MDSLEREDDTTSVSEEDLLKQREAEESLLRQQQKAEEKLRTIGLFGDVDSARTEEVIYGLHALNATKLKKTPIDYLDFGKGIIETIEPVEFLISTVGGDACDMFAIYDTIRYLRDDMEIKTFGLGKVMSAGVLLLACGTSGQRRIGQNCRVMLHGVASASQGNISNLKAEMIEIKKIQEMYINALLEETKLTKAQLKRIMNKNVNVYLSAEESVAYGIADIIV